MRFTRTSTSCAPPGRNTSSFWRATTSTRWITPTCSPTCRRRGPTARSPASRCRSQQASDFGVMAVDESMGIVDFLEKPHDPPAMAGKPDRALASMGIYVFYRRFPLCRAASAITDDPTSSHDFGKDIIPNLVSRGLAAAHRFRGKLRQDNARRRGLLARRRHDRRLLGGQSRPGDADPVARHLRSELADLDLSAAIAAGEIRVRRRRPPRHGGRFDGVGRLHHLRRDSPALAVVLELPGQFLRSDLRGGAAARRPGRPLMRGSTRSSSTAAAASRRGS